MCAFVVYCLSRHCHTVGCFLNYCTGWVSSTNSQLDTFPLLSSMGVCDLHISPWGLFQLIFMGARENLAINFKAREFRVVKFDTFYVSLTASSWCFSNSLISYHDSIIKNCLIDKNLIREEVHIMTLFIKWICYHLSGI